MKHLITKFKYIDSISSTNSNPQSIVDLLCLYKEWHHFQGTNYLYPSLQGYITFASLLFPLIRPHKVVHYHINHGHYVVYNKFTTLGLGHRKFAIHKSLVFGLRIYQWHTYSDIRFGL